MLLSYRKETRMNRKLLLGIAILTMLVLACGSTTTSSRSAPFTPEPPTPAGPVLFTARAIELKRDGLTDLQFDAYKTSVLGKEIHFVGSVTEVYPDGRVLINFSSTKRMMTRGVLYGIPVEEAIKINQDQIVRGTGTVNEVYELLGLSIGIEVNALQ